MDDKDLQKMGLAIYNFWGASELKDRNEVLEKLRDLDNEELWEVLRKALFEAQEHGVHCGRAGH